jgi:hypothetical protein
VVLFEQARSMSNLVKKALKNVREIRDLMDIPAMKAKRDGMRNELHYLNHKVKVQEERMALEETMKKAIALLTALNETSCLDVEEVRPHSVLVVNALTSYCHDSAAALAGALAEREQVEVDLEKLCKKIKAAR